MAIRKIGNRKSIHKYEYHCEVGGSLYCETLNSKKKHTIYIDYGFRPIIDGLDAVLSGETVTYSGQPRLRTKYRKWGLVDDKACYQTAYDILLHHFEFGEKSFADVCIIAFTKGIIEKLNTNESLQISSEEIDKFILSSKIDISNKEGIRTVNIKNSKRKVSYRRGDVKLGITVNESTVNEKESTVNVEDNKVRIVSMDRNPMNRTYEVALNNGGRIEIPYEALEASLNEGRTETVLPALQREIEENTPTFEEEFLETGFGYASAVMISSHALSDGLSALPQPSGFDLMEDPQSRERQIGGGMNDEPARDIQRVNEERERLIRPDPTGMEAALFNVGITVEEARRILDEIRRTMRAAIRPQQNPREQD